jgi:serine/threonine protein kinase
VVVAQSVLEGLRALHQSGTYHQDVKIENVIVGEDGMFKLCDFGSCTTRTIDFATINKAEYANLKEEMEAVTTPMYRPPEMVDPYLQL